MIPVIMIEGMSLAEMYEKALIELYEKGINISTDYDKQGDVLSRDCTIFMHVKDPFTEPMIHRCFPGGLEDLEEYKQEVLDGIKDDFIRDKNDPSDNRWMYTYHQRIKDQIPGVLNELARNPYTRRAQITTWIPETDIFSEDPPCLQRLWYRCTREKDFLTLNCNVSMRSNDAFKASFMNMFAFVMLQQRIAEMLQNEIQQEVKVGQYTHMADSFHIYGKDLHQFEALFLNSIKSRNFEERTYTLDFCTPFFEEAKAGIRQKIENMRR